MEKKKEKGAEQHVLAKCCKYSHLELYAIKVGSIPMTHLAVDLHLQKQQNMEDKRN